MTRDRPAVTVVSPHFDDVPLSLGQSLSDGLALWDVTVRVVFGRTNWTNWVHPTPRLCVSGWWRRARRPRRRGRSATASAPRGGARRCCGGVTLDPHRLLDETADLSDEPLRRRGLRAWLAAARPSQPPGATASSRPAARAGLGGHVDHRIVALAAASVAPAIPTALGFYEDRPYVAYLDEGAIRAQLEPLGPDLTVRDVSGPIRAATHRRVRRCYPSQMDPYFTRAMDQDLAAGAAERVWFPSGRVPDWFT